MSYHPKADEIARLGGGALVPRLAARVDLHVENCARCRKTRARILAVRQALAAATYPRLPDSMASEIGLAIAIEISQRNLRKPGSRKRERARGVPRRARGFAKLPHVACAYLDTDGFAVRVVEYAEDGIAAGQYLELVGLGSPDGLRGQFRQVASSETVRQALGSGQAALRDVDDFFQYTGEVVDAEATVAQRIATAESARAAGFNGSRIIADCTTVTATPQQRHAFAQYEHLLDCQTLDQPITACCAYDARALRLGAVAELACMHRHASDLATPFQLYAEKNAAIGLTGTLSEGAVPLFASALRRAGKPRGSELVIDARSADYIGRQALGALSTHAQEMNVTAVLRVSRSQSTTLAAQYPALTIEAALSRFRACRVPGWPGGRSHTWRFSRALLIAWPAIRPHPG